MTHQQEILCFLLALPTVLATGLLLGQTIILRRLGAELHDEQRPRLILRRVKCRIVTEGEYQWLRASRRLREVD